MFQDTNCLRGQWRIGIIDKVKPGSDGIVRNCTVKYKNARPGKSFVKTFTKVERPVQRLSLLIPNESIDDKFDDILNCHVKHLIVLDVNTL